MSDLLTTLKEAEAAKARCAVLRSRIEAAMGEPVLVLTRFVRPGADARYVQVADHQIQCHRQFDAADDEAALTGLLNALMADYPHLFQQTQHEAA